MPPVLEVSANKVDTPRHYDYAASVIETGNGDTRVAVTTGRRMPNGRHNDAIVTRLLSGKGLTRPFYLADGRLVADPHLLRVGKVYVVLHTVGHSDGWRNGVGWYRTDPRAQPRPETHRMLIPHATNPGTYGIGQPSVAVLPDGRMILFCRDDGPGAGLQRAWWLDVGPIRCDLGAELRFAQPEDGASVEWFWWAGRLWALVAGGDIAGVRSYRLDADGTITRERDLELPGTWARSQVAVPRMVDGCAIERKADNTPRISAGVLGFWQARGDITQPGTWEVVRHELRMPPA